MYEPVIGMEVHVQLLTDSKMFCGCSADYAAAPPNTHVCPVCLGLPGVLPVINEKAVAYSIMTGLALNCEVPEFTKWDRKNYPYPDLPKGYQISQYDMPLTKNGWLVVEVEGRKSRIGIRRAHLEEDTAKLTHVGDRSLIDFNRSGVPLLEIVSEPDMHSAEEARLYLVKLRTILRYLGVSTGNMEQGAMRCEANISLRPAGSDVLPRAHVEVKNLNSFRSVKQALEYEIERQTRVMESGDQVEQVTMGWDEARGITFVQRTKEEAHDYRYFPEPDLPPLKVRRSWVNEIQASMPELPDSRVERFVAQHGLTLEDAITLATEREVADYFDAVVEAAGDTVVAKSIANWITGPLFREMNAANVSIDQIKIRPKQLLELITLVETGKINTSTGREVLEAMFGSGENATAIVQERGLVQISDDAQLMAYARRAIEDNPKAVEDYRSGKIQAVKFLVGQVMRLTRGQANPQVVEEQLKEILSRY